MARDRSSVPMVYGTGVMDERPAIRDVVARHTLPWIPLPLMLGAGALAHLAWGDTSGLPLVTAGLSVGTVGIAAGAWSISKKHGAPVGAHISGTVSTAGLWLVLATVWGITPTVASLWALIGPLFALSWNVRMAIKPRRQEGNGEPKSPRAAGRALMAALGVKGTDMVPTEVGQARVAGVLEVDGSNTIDDVQKKAHQLAAAVGAPKAGVRINGDPTNASRGEFSVTLRDVLRESTPWPGPTHVGGTPFDPVPMGLDETGQVRTKTVADPAGAKHEIVQGITGAGKSSGTKVELCELMPRRETGIIVIDTVKGIQTFGPAARGLAKLVIDPKLAEKVLIRLKSHVIRARTDYLGAHDLSEWQPGCGLTFLSVQVEEAATFLADMDDEEIKGIVRAARSAGIRIVISLQRPSHDEISTTVRSQFGSVTCYGMNPDDVVCLLPSDVEEAGADPRQWADRQPGCNYYTGTGISTAQASTALRNYNIDVSTMRQHAATYGPHMDPIDPVTVKAFGDLWTRLGDPVDVVERAKAKALGTGPARPAIERPANDEGDTVTSHNDTGDPDEDHLTEEDMGVHTPDPDPDMQTTIDDDVDPIDVDVPFGEPTDEVATDQARAAVAARIAELEQADADTVRATDFAELVRSGIRSRGWFRKELLRLVKRGRLTDEGAGVFGIVPIDPDDQDDDQDDQAA